MMILTILINYYYYKKDASDNDDDDDDDYGNDEKEKKQDIYTYLHTNIKNVFFTHYDYTKCYHMIIFFYYIYDNEGEEAKILKENFQSVKREIL